MGIDVYKDSYAAYRKENVYEWTHIIPISFNYASPGSSEYRILRTIKNNYNCDKINIIFHTSKGRIYFPHLTYDISLATIEKDKRYKKLMELYLLLVADEEKTIIDYNNYCRLIDNIISNKTIHLFWSKDYYKFNNGLTFHLDDIGIKHNPRLPGNHMNKENNDKLVKFLTSIIKDQKWIS